MVRTDRRFLTRMLLPSTVVYDTSQGQGKFSEAYVLVLCSSNANRWCHYGSQNLVPNIYSIVAMKTIQSMRMLPNLNILSYGIQLLIKEGHHNFFHLLGMYHRPKPYQVRTQDPLLPATGLAERESRAHSLLHRVPRNTSRTPSVTVSLGLLILFLTVTQRINQCLVS